MNSFIAMAKNNVTDVRSFLAQAAGGNSIKYSPVGGETHHIYIPSLDVEVVDPNTGAKVVQKQLIAISKGVHEWKTPDNKFHSCICLDGMERIDETGITLNDKTCPFCDRKNDAWDILNYRMAEEEGKTTLKGTELENHLKEVKKQLMGQLKANRPTLYMYCLVVKYKMKDKTASTPVIGADGLPEFELKVMKLSSQRLEKINNQLKMSGLDFVGAEIGFLYPDFSGPEAAKLIVGQSTITPLFGQANYIQNYPGLKEKIDVEISKFVWSDIEKAFGEWKGMTTADAKNLMDSSFEKWDKYKIEKMSNPQIKYLEYVAKTPETPEINIPQATIPQATIPAGIGTADMNAGVQMPTGGVQMPTVGAEAPATTSVAPEVGAVTPDANVVAPGITLPDPNALFNGVNAPSI